MKKIRYLFLLLAILIILIPTLKTNTQEGLMSEVTNSYLTELNTEEGLDPANINLYLADRIGYHDQVLTAYQILNSLAFGVLDHPHYQYGEDQYIYSRSINREADQEFLDAFAQVIKKAQDYCQENGSYFIYAINPGKSHVYKDPLPEGVLYNDDFYTFLEGKLDEYGVNWISNREVLIEKSKEKQVYNVKADPGHWNDLGAYYATNNMLSKIKEDFPSIELLEEDDFTYADKEIKYLPNSRFPVNEKVPVLENKTQVENIKEEYDFVETHPSYRSFAVFDQSMAERAEELPEALFFHGSYYNSWPHIYNSSFKRTAHIHNYENFLNLDYYYEIFPAEIVILETADYATSRNYFSMERMEEIIESGF